MPNFKTTTTKLTFAQMQMADTALQQYRYQLLDGGDASASYTKRDIKLISEVLSLLNVPQGGFAAGKANKHKTVHFTVNQHKNF
jgi:hypothetical protein